MSPQPQPDVQQSGDVQVGGARFSKENSSLVIACNAWNYDEVGGAYKIATEFAMFCAERGWDVHYVSGHRKGTGVPDEEFGVKVWRYPQPAGSGKGKSAGNLFWHVSQTRRLMPKIRATAGAERRLILNGHSPLQYLGLITANGDFPASRKVMSVHSPMAREYLAEKEGSRLGVRDYLAAWTLKRIEEACYRKSDAIQCDSDFTRSILAKDFSRQTDQRLTVCPGYVDLKKFALIDMPRSEARRSLGGKWITEQTMFFCLRRHVERTGIDNLIKACAWVREKLSSSGNPSKFRVMIGGDGPLRMQLEALKHDLGLDDYVYFLGRMPESSLELAYRAADCFVLPTRGLECFGLIILESFSVGTPVIATPVGSIPEVLGSFAEGSLTENTEPEAIGKAMLDFMINNKWQHREHELYRHAKIYDKNDVLRRLESIVIGN